MKSVKMVGGLVALALTGLTIASAQEISVGARTDGSSFLLYEPIRVEVGLRNNTGVTVELKSTADRSWLQFFIVDPHGREVKQLAAVDASPVVIGPRQTVSRVVNLLPLFDLREEGAYTIQTMIKAEGVQAAAMPLKISICRSRDLWTQTVGLPPPPGGKTQYRTYALINKHERLRDVLYASIRDEQAGVVFGMLDLGRYVALRDPEAAVDKAGNLHVLWRLAPRQLGYVEIDPFAEYVDRAVYNDLISLPHLVQASDGTVHVEGGQKIWPNPDKNVVTEAELDRIAAMIEPVKPPPKKHWWEFWKRTPRPANAPAVK